MTPSAPDILLQRIDRLTGQLNPSVARAGGAQFALMLSMIYQAQQLVVGAAASGSAAPGAARLTPFPQYTPAMVARLGSALQAGQRGELAMLVSWLDSVPVKLGPSGPASERDAEVRPSLAQAALLAKSYSLLDEIKQSSLSVAA